MFVLNLIMLFIISVLATCVFTETPFNRRSLGIAANPKSWSEIMGYRLPNDTEPVIYDISISTRIDLPVFHFNGVVRIGIIVGRRTNRIVLHARQLTIVTVTLARINDNTTESISILPYSFHPVPEFLQISTHNTVFNTGDTLLLRITYTGILRTDRKGFHRSSYENTDGSTS